jgi:hypothetical protein|tara:strand:+ start:447 stop:1106 length:660 start_codon:yes stop_codon:yes gene_type:complete
MNDELRKRSFIELDVKIEFEKLLKEYHIIDKKYAFHSYKTNYWAVRKKYAKSWSGVCLTSSDGNLYTDLHENRRNIPFIDTEIKKHCPYIYKLIKDIGGDKCSARIMRISPKESLVWHSHVQEHGQNENQLTVQIPIIVPKQFQYCVVNKDEFKWYKRFFKPSWFKNAECKRLETGKAYIFNSYHYHNVYNHSNEYRITLMLYLDLRNPTVYNLVHRSL